MDRNAENAHTIVDRPHDLWFVMGLAHKQGYFDSPAKALEEWLPQDDADLVPTREFSETNNTTCLLVRGSPDPNHTDYEVFFWGNDGFTAGRRNNGILSVRPALPGYPERLVWINRGKCYTPTKDRVRTAMLAGRQARFEYGERG